MGNPHVGSRSESAKEGPPSGVQQRGSPKEIPLMCSLRESPKGVPDGRPQGGPARWFPPGVFPTWGSSKGGLERTVPHAVVNDGGTKVGPP